MGDWDSRIFEFCCGIAEFRAEDAPQKKDDVFGVGYGVVTTIARQKAEIANLKKMKYKVLAKFTNPQTGRRVTLWGRKLG